MTLSRDEMTVRGGSTAVAARSDPIRHRGEFIRLLPFWRRTEP
jgi:hypothetical protein